ncbi:MAG: radical SAM protein, partial [Candidatus Latescibacterota bacterium]
MKVGILEISTLPSRNLFEKAYNVVYNKQITSITPQAISVWCRQLGHETFYATYYGRGNIQNLLPKDLDLVFIACTTYVSALAYAVAKLYRKAGVQTVVGGAHAKAFPADCLRFFDLVVKECDKNLIADILNGHFDPGSYISSAQPCDDFPSVEERATEIRATALIMKRWYTPFPFTVVPVMTSTGCP